MIRSGRFRNRILVSLLLSGPFALTVVPYSTVAQGQPQGSVSDLVTSSSVTGLIAMVNQTAHSHSQYFQATGLQQSILNLYGVLSSSGTFQSALQQHGPSSFSWGLGYNFKSGIGGSTAGFVVSWADGQVMRALSWTAFLGNGSLSGPSNLVWPLFSMTSTNWAGYETWQSGETIDQALATANIPSISNPPANQIDATVHQVANAWIGMSPLAGGGGGLIQTGFTRDVTNNEAYDFWWELFPKNFSQAYTAAECGTGITHGAVGDSVQEGVSQSGGSNNGFSIYDITSNDLCTASFTQAETPVYAQAVVEAFGYCTNHQSIIQQIADLGSTVTFGSGSVEAVASGGQKNVETFNFLYNQGWYTNYLLQQNTIPSQNILNGYDYTAGGPTMSWQNSWYNYNYVNGNPPAC
jgi:hypothetical protein